jgi:subtilisin family serine protease
MKAALALALFIGVCAAAPIAIAPRGGVVVPDEFIITIDKHANSGVTMQTLQQSIDKIVAATNGQVLHKYNKVLQGFAIRTNADGVNMLRALNGVQIEANLQAHALCEDQDAATWGLVRTSERELKIDGHFFHTDLAGEGVDAYIVDTGIYIEHEDFEGRASWGTDTVDNPSPKTDGNGHGTHVAGTVAGKTWGIAKKANLIAVKVLGASGSGTWAGVIAGMEWVVDHHQSKPTKRPSTANMSLGGGYSAAINEAADAMVNAGVGLAVAAGNENQNACNVSPASSARAMTVGATDKFDARSYFSNWGKCVKVFGPGSDITSAWIGGKTATRAISGTSMASPHVCGVLTRIFAANPNFTPDEAFDLVKKTATPDAISNPGTASPNLLAYIGCEI